MNEPPYRSRGGTNPERIAVRVVLCDMVVALLILGLRAAWLSFAAPRTDFAEADNSTLVGVGGGLYREHCASCHGANLEGQPGWQRVAANGCLPAPPQDDHGHSWMHSDAELLHTIKFSLRDEGESMGRRNERVNHA